jgi:hypothetical protein
MTGGSHIVRIENIQVFLIPGAPSCWKSTSPKEVSQKHFLDDKMANEIHSFSVCQITRLRSTPTFPLGSWDLWGPRVGTKSLQTLREEVN